MNRKFKEEENPLITKALYVALIILLLILFNCARTSSQEYNCTILTTGVKIYTSTDSNITKKLNYENDSYCSFIEFPVGYGSFVQTVEEEETTFLIQPGTLHFSTETMLMSLVFKNDISDSCHMLVDFKKEAITIDWIDGKEINTIIFDIGNWTVENIPLDLQIKKKE